MYPIRIKLTLVIVLMCFSVIGFAQTSMTEIDSIQDLNKQQLNQIYQLNNSAWLAKDDNPKEAQKKAETALEIINNISNIFDLQTIKSESHNILGATLARQGRIEDAEKEFDEAKKIIELSSKMSASKKERAKAVFKNNQKTLEIVQEFSKKSTLSSMPLPFSRK
ncbi:MAG: hypothetical protein ACPGVB_09050 [Chitinophagales bacterium]